MKAIVYRSYGKPDVLAIEEVDTPTPGEGEILVRNFATTVTAAESAARKGEGAARLYFGMFRPKFPILGSTFAGTVVAVGTGVTRFAVGDEVFGDVGPRFGALAEFARVRQDGVIAHKPAGLSFTEAAAVFDGSLTALPFLRDNARLRAGQSILINGASGAVGSAAVQLAHHFGAHVTAVCTTANHDLVRSLGADAAIDYTVEDFTRTGATYDVVFDAIGKNSFSRSRRALTGSGIYLTTVPGIGILVQMLTTKWSRKKAGIAFTGLRPAAEIAKDLAHMTELAVAGHFVPVIDREYPIERAADAHEYVDTGRKRGSVIITIGDEPATTAVAGSERRANP